MKVFIYRMPLIDFISEYFDFNRLPFDDINLWDTELDTYGRHNISDQLLDQTDCLLVIEIKVLADLISWDHSFDRLVKFLRNNQLLVSQNGDSYFPINYHIPHFNKQNLERLSNLIPKNSITWLSDYVMSDHYWIKSLRNIRVCDFPNITPSMIEFSKFPRIVNAVTEKKNASKDYMLTMVRLRGRPHRKILWNELTNRPGLIERGHAVFNRLGEPRIGVQPHQHTWSPGFPSMDLYLDSWLEVVPETLCKDGYYITEKTMKPIATRTPFLMVSTARFLDYLKSLGFMTFDSLIDETYDQQHRIQDRARLVVDQLEDIIRNGSESFYHASQPILNHNQAKLAELVGLSQHDMDLCIHHCLTEIKQVD
jgi:hypothetical protein